MDLNNISIETRTRKPWEAIDLGFVMTRAWWKPLFLSWFIPASVVFVIASLIFYQYSWVSYFIVWWFKPLFDRGPLLIASRRLFGEELAPQKFFQELLSLYKFDSLMWLTFRRFSPTRSFDMPLTVLEKARGEQRAARQRVLHSHYSNAASWLTWVSVHIESFIVLGAISFIALLIPEQASVDYSEVFLEQNPWIDWISNLFILASMALVGPFYAVCGFAMYISRRIDLEAWDIEIRFRQLAEDHQKKTTLKQNLKAPLSVALFVTLTLGTTTVLFPQPVLAQESSLPAKSPSSIELYTQTQDDNPSAADEAANSYRPDSDYAYKVKDDIVTVLEGDDFHHYETVKRWRLKNTRETKPGEIPQWLLTVIRFFEDNSGFFATVKKIISFPLLFIEYLLWGGLVLLLIYIAAKYRKEIKNFITPNSGDLLPKQPTVMFGLDVTRESLPDDVPSSVLNLWNAGDQRAAIALLYRALLSELIHRHQFQFRDSFTEGECMALVKSQADAPLTDYAGDITLRWQQIAYGHLAPTFEQVDHLCSQWPRIFSDREATHG